MIFCRPSCRGRISADFYGVLDFPKSTELLFDWCRGGSRSQGRKVHLNKKHNTKTY